MRLVAASSIAGLLALGQLAFGAAYTLGDVFASVGNGQVKEFTPTGTLVQTLDNGIGSTFTAGSVFDTSGNFYVTTFGSNVISKFDSNGNLVNANFVTGFNSDVESITRDMSGNFYAGEADGSHLITKFDSSGTVLNTWAPATQNRGTDWVDLAGDQHTIYYTSEASEIKRFDVATGTQLPDFTNQGSTMYEFRILSDGGVLAANSGNVLHFDSSGNIIHTYSGFGGGTLFALNLDPDGTSFWTGDLGTGDVFHIDIATGTMINQFNAGANTALGGLSVFGEITQGGGGGGNVPEPASFVLLGSALAGVAVLKYTRLGRRSR